MRTKIFDKILETCKIVCQRLNAFVGNFANRNCAYKFSFAIKYKSEIIGKNQITKRRFVTVELFLVSCFFESFKVTVANIFCLDKTNGNVFCG